MTTIQKHQFSAVDYVVFIGTFAVSLAIGIYYALFGKQNTNKEFLMAGKQMGAFPVAMSLMISFVSSITILGIPAEIFYFGLQYSLEALSIILALILTATIMLPLLYPLDITSAYEYLELRFKSRGVRQIATITFMMSTFMYMAVVLYSPAVALSIVTPLSIPASIFTVGAVVTVYTGLGGLRAVLWTDVFQVFVMTAGLLFICIQGTIDAGGIKNVWNLAEDYQRTKIFDFSPNPMERMNFWSVMVGLTMLWFSFYGTTQTQVQRYLSMKSYRTAQIALFMNIPLMMIVKLLAFFSGIVAFAAYSDCDPLSNGLIEKKDQLMPYYVMHQMGHFSGLPGLYIASVFCASLSTLSSGLNSLATVTWEDFLQNTRFGRWVTGKEWSLLFNKGLSFLYGAMAVGLSFLVGSMGTILDAILKVNGALIGPVLGAFLLGAYLPFCNKYGVGAAMILSHCVTLWLTIGAQVFNKGPFSEILPFDDDCPADLIQNATFAQSVSNATSTEPEDYSFNVYRITFMYFALIGLVITSIVGIGGSLLTGGFPYHQLDDSLVLPITRRWLKGRKDKMKSQESIIKTDKKYSSKDNSAYSQAEKFSYENNCEVVESSKL